MWSASIVGDYHPRRPSWATSSCIRESQGTDSVSAVMQVSPPCQHTRSSDHLEIHNTYSGSFTQDLHSWEASLWRRRRMCWNHPALLTPFEAYRSLLFPEGNCLNFCSGRSPLVHNNRTSVKQKKPKYCMTTDGYFSSYSDWQHWCHIVLSMWNASFQVQIQSSINTAVDNPAGTTVSIHPSSDLLCMQQCCRDLLPWLVCLQLK